MATTFHAGFAELLYVGRIIPMAAYVSAIFLGLMVLSRNPKGATNRIFSVLALFVAIWNVALFFVLDAQSPQEADGLWKIYRLAVLLLVPAWLYFATYFAGRRVMPLLLYVPSFAFVPLVFFTDLLQAGITKVDSAYLPLNGGPVFTLYSFYILFYILYGIFELLRVYSTSTSLEKQRIKWMCIGTGTLVIVASFDVLTRLAGVYMLPFSPAASIIMVAAIAYSFMLGEE